MIIGLAVGGALLVVLVVVLIVVFARKPTNKSQERV